MQVSKSTITFVLTGLFGLSLLTQAVTSFLATPAPAGASVTPAIIHQAKPARITGPSAQTDTLMITEMKRLHQVHHDGRTTPKRHRRERTRTTPAAVTAPQTPAPPAPVTYPAGGNGIYSYRQLEQLWVSAGGPASAEATAACIAEHESGGNPHAISPTDDWGLWQIHAGGYAMFSPQANAAAAVAKYRANGWLPWTTRGSCGV